MNKTDHLIDCLGFSLTFMTALTRVLCFVSYVLIRSLKSNIK
jgi:hypothetical protein